MQGHAQVGVEKEDLVDVVVVEGSLLEVCINDLCNAEDEEPDPPSSRVSVHYAAGQEHPSFAEWSVARRTNGSWESLAGGRIDLACTRDSTSVRIVLDESGDATVTQSSIQSP